MKRVNGMSSKVGCSAALRILRFLLRALALHALHPLLGCPSTRRHVGRLTRVVKDQFILAVHHQIPSSSEVNLKMNSHMSKEDIPMAIK